MSDYGSGTPVGQRPAGGGGSGSDLKTLAKNPKFQLAAAGVALVGVVVLIMRRGSGSAGDQAAAAGAAGGGTKGYVQGGGDTTGTDIASYLSSWGQLQDSRFADFLHQIQGNTPPAGSGIGPGLGRVTGVRDNQPGVWTDSLQLGWNKVEGATGYKIRNYADPSKVIDAGNVDAYQIRDLVHNGSYFWQVAAIGPDGTLGDWSDYITAHTKN